jgi:uncharacterized protein (DUF342 family)
MEMDLETILKAASDDKLATNAESFTDLINSIDGIIKQGDKILGFINRLERSTLVGTLMKAQMKKAGVDVGPLTKDDGGIHPRTDSHAQILQNINSLDENQLKDLVQRLLELDQKKIEEEKNNAKANDKANNKSKPAAD